MGNYLTVSGSQFLRPQNLERTVNLPQLRDQHWEYLFPVSVLPLAQPISGSNAKKNSIVASTASAANSTVEKTKMQLQKAA